MLLNRIRPAVDIILRIRIRKIRMVLELIDLPLGRYLLLEELSKAQMQKKSDSYYPFHRFIQSFRFHTSGKDGRDTRCVRYTR